MREWRADGRDAVLELPNGRRVRCTDLSDKDIYEQARRFAEIDVNRSIYEFNRKL